MDCSKGTRDGALEGPLDMIPVSILDGEVVEFTVFSSEYMCDTRSKKSV